MTTMKITTESLQSLVSGGIAFVTPNNDKMGAQVLTGHQFTLHEDVGKNWLKWTPEFSLQHAEKIIPNQPESTTNVAE